MLFSPETLLRMREETRAAGAVMSAVREKTLADFQRFKDLAAWMEPFCKAADERYSYLFGEAARERAAELLRDQLQLEITIATGGKDRE